MMDWDKGDNAARTFLATALTLALLAGCGNTTPTRAGERWDDHGNEAREVIDAPEAAGTPTAPATPQAAEEAEPVAVVPASPSELKGEHVEDVCYRLIKAGFTNVEPREDADLRAGVLHDEGDVSKVTIEGDKRFHQGDEYAPDARVVVEYHTWRKRNKREISIDELEDHIAAWIAEERADGGKA